MNRTEMLAFEWLKQQGYKEIVFRGHQSPDFVTSNGGFEVKKSCNNNITFGAKQFSKLKKMENVKILVYSNSDCLDAIIPIEELDENKTRWGEYRILGMNNNYTVANISVPVELWCKSKAEAIMSDKTLNQWIVELLEKGVGDKNG